MLMDKERQITPNSKRLNPAFIILAVLAFLQWSPPGFFSWLESFRWYLMAGIAGFLFIQQGKQIKISNSRFFILFYLLFWSGILLSLFRTNNPEETLYIAVSTVFPFALGLVLIPSFSHVKGRVIWLFSLGVAATLWAYRIVQLWLMLGENLRYELVGRGIDHNMIATCTASAASVFMVIALHADYAIGQPLKNATRLISFVASIGFLFCSFLTYSRAGFIVTALGIAFVILMLVVSKKMTLFFNVVFLFLFGASVLIPLVQITNPTWFNKFSELTRAGDTDTSVYVRVVLIQKTWMIIKENPIIGIGPGSFRSVDDPFIGQKNKYLPHNTYLGIWAEQGILGLLSYLVWIFLWVNLIIRNWNDYDISKKALMAVFLPFFFMLAFLDINGILNVILLAFFSSISGENNL